MTDRTVTRALLLGTALFVGLISCREGVPPFSPEEREPGPQLTFGAGQDRDPRWHPDGSTLLYHTNEYNALPGATGVLLRIPAAGGTATPLLDDVQRAFGTRVLAAPAISPDGQRIAYLDLLRIDLIAMCLAESAQPETADCRTTQPVLDSAALRVRGVNATQGPLADPAIGIRLSGVDPRFSASQGPVFVQQTLPFQRQYREYGAVLLRPSWAPDNQRIVYSNGLQLFIWRVGDATSAAVPGTADGVSPAWSPAGDRIAFTQLVRSDSTRISCGCVQPGGGSAPPVFTHVRTLYTESPRVIVMRADGSERIDLGAGQDPAWSPDGQFVYLARGGEIVRVPAAGGAAQVIPNTRLGRYPAVSPDGRRLAFSKRKPSEPIDYDIWVVSLSQ